ncbi:MAG TPA: BTAD domain-containing putative transcriptional regulator [Gaiellaceae bacterium]|nr:BTAD domain-containing putative transcriptional regulator [Gaiellaceae bacterium]
MGTEFRLLGPLEVLTDGRPAPLRAAKQRALLADLLVHRGKVVSVDRLVDDLWQESPPAGARHALEAHASRLRGALGDAAALVAQPPGYALEVEPDLVDAVRFERLLAEARAAAPEQAAELAAAALALWRGPALADFAYEPFAQAEIARLEELRWEAVHLRIDAGLALGRDGLVPELEALVAAEPLRERLRAQLMLALYRAGRQADALAVYRDARTALLDELGLEPGPELRELEAAILRQDETLARPATPPPAAAVTAPQRKLATILFVDVVDSTGLAVALDPEALHGVLRRYFDAATTAVERHGGIVEKFAGDAVMAVFGTPLAHEDDALRAARAAIEIRDAVALLGQELARELDVELQVRLGLATGEVLSGGGPGEPLATGPATIVAHRLQEEVGAGEIAVDELTRRLTAGAGRFEELGEIELRGLRQPMRAFRLEELAADAPAFVRRLDAPLVGRAHELAVLRDALAVAVRGSELRAVTILGAPGIGKSRLARELAAAVDDKATILHGRCNAYGEGTAFRPLREALGSEEAVAAALEGEPEAEAIASRLGAVFSTETTVPAEEIPWAFRRYCEMLASRRPLLVVLDDLHWAAPALLDLVESLAASARGAPILLVCIARDDLLEERPEFPGAGERVVMEPLSDEETETLVDHLLPESALDATTHDRLVAAAEGNPLFLEQLVAHVAETGQLEPPPTLRALLAARLDRLGPGERGVLERAAVAGREFDADDVAALLDAAAAPTAVAHLDALVRRGFLRPTRGRFRFRHWLIHDSAYRTAPKEVRAELHERYADVLDRAAADDELVGYHLEQAYLLRTELAPPDRHARRLAEDAGRRLGAAGLRTWKRNEARGAARMLARAVALLPLEDEDRRGLLCELGVALNTAGDRSAAELALREAIETAQQTDDRRTELRAEVELLGLHLLDEPETAAAGLLELAPRALPIFEVLGDDRSLGRVLSLTGWVHGGMHCQYALSEASAELALEHYRRSGWPVGTCLGQIAAAACFGPSPARSGAERCRSLLEGEVDDRAGEANVLVHLGGLLGMHADAGEALALVGRAREIYAELGREPTIASTCLPMAAAIERSVGDVDSAEQHLRESCQALEAMQNRNALATVAGQLADLLLFRDDREAAERWIDTALACAAPSDVDAQILVRCSRAKALVRRGRHPDAIDLARSAVALAETTDATNRRAGALLTLADVLDGSGAGDEAADLRVAAVGLYDEKENVVDADAVRRAYALPSSRSPAG